MLALWLAYFYLPRRRRCLTSPSSTAPRRSKRRSLVTPEGVDLSLKLADIGQRIGAFMIDLMIMLGILIGITLTAFAAVAALGLERAEIAVVIWLLGFFLLRNCYFILMEMGPRAATFGKRAAGPARRRPLAASG